MSLKKSKLARVLIFLFVAAAITPYRNIAQQASRQPPLQYEVSVTLKLIQVYVTDKNGKSIQDLTKDDFALYDNGKPVTITEFEKNDLTPASVRANRGTILLEYRPL